MTPILPAELYLNAINKAVAAVLAHINTYAIHQRLRQLEAESGMSYDWLRSMHQGRIPNPTIKSLQNVLVHMRRHGPSGAGVSVCGSLSPENRALSGGRMDRKRQNLSFDDA